MGVRRVCVVGSFCDQPVQFCRPGCRRFRGLHPQDRLARQARDRHQAPVNPIGRTHPRPPIADYWICQSVHGGCDINRSRRSDFSHHAVQFGFVLGEPDRWPLGIPSDKRRLICPHHGMGGDLALQACELFFVVSLRSGMGPQQVFPQWRDHHRNQQQINGEPHHLARCKYQRKFILTMRIFRAGGRGLEPEPVPRERTDALRHPRLQPDGRQNGQQRSPNHEQLWVGMEQTNRGGAEAEAAEDQEHQPAEP